LKAISNKLTHASIKEKIKKVFSKNIPLNLYYEAVNKVIFEGTVSNKTYLFSFFYSENKYPSKLLTDAQEFSAKIHCIDSIDHEGHTYQCWEKIPGDVLDYDDIRKSQSLQEKIVSYLNLLHSQELLEHLQKRGHTLSEEKDHYTLAKESCELSRYVFFQQAYIHKKASIAKRCKAIHSKIDRFLEEYTFKRGARFSLVHGDFHNDNIIKNENEKITVIDLDSASIGDPAFDFYIFMDVDPDIFKSLLKYYDQSSDETLPTRVSYYAVVELFFRLRCLILKTSNQEIDHFLKESKKLLKKIDKFLIIY